MSEFDDLLAAAIWRPIRGCPGRYVLAGDPPPALAALIADRTRTRELVVPTARDPVLVVSLTTGGGLISYQHADGGVLHTLNTASGFARKLAQLGIELP